jgi:hypothetical protein
MYSCAGSRLPACVGNTPSEIVVRIAGARCKVDTAGVVPYARLSPAVCDVRRIQEEHQSCLGGKACGDIQSHMESKKERDVAVASCRK